LAGWIRTRESKLDPVFSNRSGTRYSPSIPNRENYELKFKITYNILNALAQLQISDTITDITTATTTLRAFGFQKTRTY